MAHDIKSLAIWELCHYLEAQASLKEVLRLQKAFTLPLFVLNNIQEQCVQGKYIWDWEENLAIIR